MKKQKHHLPLRTKRRFRLTLHKMRLQLAENSPSRQIIYVQTKLDSENLTRISCTTRANLINQQITQVLNFIFQNFHISYNVSYSIIKVNLPHTNERIFRSLSAFAAKNLRSVKSSSIEAREHVIKTELKQNPVFFFNSAF